MNITSADSNSPADRAANLPSKSHLLLKVAGRHAGLNLSLSLDQALKQRVNHENQARKLHQFTQSRAVQDSIHNSVQ